MIKAVIFDICGVLCSQVGRTHRRRWEQRLGLPEDSLEKAVYDSPVGRKGFVGQATGAEVWEAFRLKFNLSTADTHAFLAEFWADEEWDEVLLEPIRSLRPRYRTGVISDALPGARHEPRVKAHVNASLFDVILFSGEEGVTKPAPAIIDKALAILGMQRAEAIFIDDDPRKVEGARTLGIHGISFETREQARAELKAMLDG